jgi:hypothetical protein
MDNKQKEKLWLSLFVTIPTIILLNYGEYISESGLNRILASGFFGAVGAIIGIMIFSKIKQKKTISKVINLILILFVGLIGMYLMNLNTKSTNSTCEICGYIAVNKDKTACNYCFSETWEALDYKEEYKNKAEWLKEEQLYWFSDSLFNDSMFYFPIEDEGYKKDKKWKPEITIDDIQKYEKEKNDTQQ